MHRNQVRAGLAALAAAVRVKQQRVFESLDLESLLSGGDGLPEPNKSMLLALLRAVNAGLPALGEFMGKRVLDSMRQLIDKHNAKTESFTEQVKKARELLHQDELENARAGWLERLEL